MSNFLHIQRFYALQDSQASPKLARGGEFKGHESLRSFEEETTHASLGEEKKSPFSSLGEVVRSESLLEIILSFSPLMSRS